MSDVGDVEFWKRQTAGLVFCWRSIKKQPKKHNSSTLLCIQIVVFDNVTFQFSGFYLIPYQFSLHRTLRPQTPGN